MDGAENSSNVRLRVLVGLIGGLLVLAGAMAWSLQKETSSLPYRVVEAPGGGFGAYWVEDLDSGQVEMEQLDDGRFIVVQIDGEESTGVFSGT